MPNRLHLVFGGELVDPTRNQFRDPDNLHIVGIFSNDDKAFSAWKAEAQRSVDNAHMRSYIAYLHRLQDAGNQRSETVAASS